MISFTRDSCVDVELYEKRLNQNGGITIDVDYFQIGRASCRERV